MATILEYFAAIHCNISNPCVSDLIILVVKCLF